MPTTDQILPVLGVVCGLLVGIPGLFWLYKARQTLSRTEGAKRGTMRLFCLGLAGCGVGYHLIVWSLLRQRVPFGIPIEYWWILPLAALVLLFGAWGYARSERIPPPPSD